MNRETREKREKGTSGMVVSKHPGSQCYLFLTTKYFRVFSDFRG